MIMIQGSNHPQGITLTLPYSPSGNTLYPTGGDKKRHISSKGNQYRQNVYGCVLEQQGIFKPLSGPLISTIGMYPPDRRKRDLDNTFKALFDALKYSNVFHDDDQIHGILAFKLAKVKPGQCIISLEPAESWCAARDFESLEFAFRTI